MGVKRKVSEEEITQYLVNKAIKKANKLKSSNRSSSSSFFSNDSNPFGDANLHEKFVWRKKIERDIAQRLPSFSVKTERKKQRERMEEIEKVKKRREQRALEKQQHEEERELLARERARAEFQDWQKKEDEFLVNQNKMRSDIRVSQGRTMPTDILSNYVVNGLSQYLQKDLQHYKPSCKRGGAVMQFVVQDEVEEEAGSSPQLLCGDNSENEAIDPAEDGAVIEERDDHIQEPVAPEQPPLLEKFNLNKAMGAMEEGDVVIGSDAEVNLDSQVEWWHDKYRPRKPKYFNAVHTGYKWSKYNRTHYDHDNPPPKIVRGYKFAIFYPDLNNRAETPTYTCENDGSNGETCILRFHAGPPYEDIAFRIVNKDWNTSHKKGFKSTFDGGILRLHFNFRRYSYRR